ncbi:MAG: type II toxin-antitoxin system RelE/ParE family toxin [Halobacteriota archaeon]
MKMRYKERYTKLFLKDVKVIKKDKVLLDRLNKKIDQILENPEHYPPKRYELKGKRSAHVGSYVILFEVVGEIVIFYRFRHHDHVYK